MVQLICFLAIVKGLAKLGVVSVFHAFRRDKIRKTLKTIPNARAVSGLETAEEVKKDFKVEFQIEPSKAPLSQLICNFDSKRNSLRLFEGLLSATDIWNTFVVARRCITVIQRKVENRRKRTRLALTNGVLLGGTAAAAVYVVAARGFLPFQFFGFVPFILLGALLVLNNEAIESEENGLAIDRLAIEALTRYGTLNESTRDEVEALQELTIKDRRSSQWDARSTMAAALGIMLILVFA